MIITVTLNAALDKTLEVPNFRLGRRHRTVEQTTMPGGKGVNIARALKRLGQPVIATGLAGGATGNQIVDALNDEAILNGFVRIREESRTNTAVLDPTTGLQTEINERGPAVSAQDLELFREKLLYLAKGASICVFAGSLPRGVEPDVYAGLIRELGASSASRRSSTLTASRCGSRCAPSPTWCRRTSSRPRSWSATSSTTPTTGPARSIEMARLGPRRGDHDGLRRVLCARARGRRARAVTGSGSTSWRRARAIGSGDAFLAGYIAARYLGRSPAECLRYGVACGAESASTSAPGCSIRRPWSGCCRRSSSSDLQIGAEIG